MSERSGSVAVVGGGPFGRGLAVAVARARGEVLLWSRRSQVSVDGENVPAGRITVTADLAEVARRELVLLAVPATHAKGVLEQLAPHLDGSNYLVHVSRGLVDDELNTMSMLIRRTTPVRRLGALAGPLTAPTLKQGDPGGAVAGSDFPEVITALRGALGSERLRLYETSDLVGVELASALTGMLLFAVGYARGMGLSPATVGVFATRGVAEIMRVGVALGARAETFYGLACVGDLFAALGGETRPEIRVGERVAAGTSPRAALAESSDHVESDLVALRVARLADRLQVQTPIASVVGGLLQGEISPEEAIARLMRRRVGRE